MNLARSAIYTHRHMLVGSYADTASKIVNIGCMCGTSPANSGGISILGVGYDDNAVPTTKPDREDYGKVQSTT